MRCEDIAGAPRAAQLRRRAALVERFFCPARGETVAASAARPPTSPKYQRFAFGEERTAEPAIRRQASGLCSPEFRANRGSFRVGLSIRNQTLIGNFCRAKDYKPSARKVSSMC